MANARRRYYRTIFLGVAAMGVLVWSAMEQFGISQQEMLELFYGVLVGVLAMIVLAALLVTVWMLVRRLLRRQPGSSANDTEPPV
jgi:uncharacterized membrane protein